MKKQTKEAIAYQTIVLHGVTHVVLPASDLFTDEKIQRDLSKKQVKDIVANFDWEFVNEPLVTREKNGKYKCADGQHTLSSIRKKFSEDELILCRVTTKPAHIAFIQQNSNRRAVTNNAKFWSNLGGGAPIENAILRICERHDIILQRRGRPRINCTRAVAMLRHLWDVVGGEKNFSRVIATISSCFRRPDGEAIELDALTSLFLEGVATFYQTCPYQQYEVEYALHRSKISSADIIKEAYEAPCSNSTRHLVVAERLRGIVKKHAK